MISVAVFPESQLRELVFAGVINEDALFRAFQEVVLDPNYDASLDELFDLSAVQNANVTPKSLRWLGENLPPYAGRRLAIVAPSDFLFGMARMYQSFRAGADEEIRIFRARPDAETWLLSHHPSAVVCASA